MKHCNLGGENGTVKLLKCTRQRPEHPDELYPFQISSWHVVMEYKAISDKAKLVRTEFVNCRRVLTDRSDRQASSDAGREDPDDFFSHGKHFFWKWARSSEVSKVILYAMASESAREPQSQLKMFAANFARHSKSRTRQV
jgi:hypothetical protein